MNNTDTLRTVGQCLYGPQWQTGIARDLGVNVRTVRRWVAGDSAMPGDALEKLRKCVMARLAALKGVLSEMPR